MIDRKELDDLAVRLVVLDEQLARSIVQASRDMARRRKGVPVIKLALFGISLDAALNAGQSPRRQSTKPRGTAAGSS